MSWPDDNEPRFIVTTVTGWRVEPGKQTSKNSGAPGTSAQVLDRAYCDRLVREFTPDGARTNALCKQAADDLAAELNEREAAEALSAN